MDALAHAVDAYTGLSKNPLSDTPIPGCYQPYQ